MPVTSCSVLLCSETWYGRALWRVLLIGMCVPAFFSCAWASDSGAPIDSDPRHVATSSPISNQPVSEVVNILSVEDLLTDAALIERQQAAAASKKTIVTNPARSDIATNDRAKLIPIQAQGPEHAVKLSANGQSLLLRTIPPVANSTSTLDTDNVFIQSSDSAAADTPSPAPAGMDDLNATLRELLPTAWRYGVELSAFQGGRWQQANRSIPLHTFTYTNLKQLFFSQNGQILALTAGAQGSLDALRITAQGQIQKLLPDDMARISAVTAMDATGTTIAGWLLAKTATAVPQGFIWHQEHGVTLLPPEQVVPMAISADGSQMILDAYLADRALLQRHHQFSKLPADLPGSQGGGAFAISQDGTRATGYTYGESDYVRGWLWDSTHGYNPVAWALHISNADSEDPDKWQAFSDQLTGLAGLTQAEQQSSLKMRLLRRDTTGQTDTVVDEGLFWSYAPLSKTLVWEAWREDQGPMLSREGQRAISVPAPDGLRPQDLVIVQLSANGQSLLTGNAEQQIVTREQRQIAVPDEVFGSSLVMSADGRILVGTYADEQWNKPKHIFWMDLDSGKRLHFVSCSAVSGWRQNVMLSDKGNELIFSDEEGGYCRYTIKDTQ